MRYIKQNKFTEIEAFNTTKAVGNVAYQVRNDEDEVKRARATIINDLGINSNQLVIVHQPHSDHIEKVDESIFWKRRKNILNQVKIAMPYIPIKSILF